VFLPQVVDVAGNAEGVAGLARDDEHDAVELLEDAVAEGVVELGGATEGNQGAGAADVVSPVLKGALVGTLWVGMRVLREELWGMR
jgi:hypothetical protein